MSLFFDWRESGDGSANEADRSKRLFSSVDGCCSPRPVGALLQLLVSGVVEWPSSDCFEGNGSPFPWEFYDLVSQGSPVRKDMVQVDWVQPQSSIWSDGRCHEIRFICTGARALGTCHYYDRWAVQWQQRNWARRN